MFNKLFRRQHTIQRHQQAPLLEERMQYLNFWDKNGARVSTLRAISSHYNDPHILDQQNRKF